MKKIGTRGFTTIVLLLVIVGLIYYTYLNNNASNRKKVDESSEVQQLLEYDFVNNYPKTVRETVKLHLNYLKNIYNDKFTEDELFTVNRQIRQLFDEDLLEINTEDKQLQGLKDEMQLYKENKQKFVSFSLAEGSQVQYNTEDDIEYAKIRASLVIKVSSASTSVDEEYILRKDSEGKWKILGWQRTDNSSSADKGDTD